jgi:hypothetical protein
MPTHGPRDPRIRSQGELPTKNFFAPMRASEMEVECSLVEETTDKHNREPQLPSFSKSGRTASIVLTSTTNLMHCRGI